MWMKGQINGRNIGVIRTHSHGGFDNLLHLQLGGRCLGAVDAAPRKEARALGGGGVA
jgi:hypothetical protein